MNNNSRNKEYKMKYKLWRFLKLNLKLNDVTESNYVKMESCATGTLYQIIRYINTRVISAPKSGMLAWKKVKR